MIPQYDDDDADDDGADEVDVELDQKADVAMQCFMTRPVCEISLNTDNATYFWCRDGSCHTKKYRIWSDIFKEYSLGSKIGFNSLVNDSLHKDFFLKITQGSSKWSRILTIAKDHTEVFL